MLSSFDMRKYLLLSLSLLLSFNLNAKERRCGWLENPSPANLWLIDKDATWFISAQGRFNLDNESVDLVYDAIKNDQNFVRTNRNHGFSCACLTVDVNQDAKEIVKVYESTQLNLKRCLEDIAIIKHIPLPFK